MDYVFAKNQFLPDFPPPSTRDIFPSVLCLWTTLGELKTKLSRRISSGFLINSDAVDITAYFACFLSLLVYATVLWDFWGNLINLYDRCLEDTDCHNVNMSIYLCVSLIIFSRTLIGQRGGYLKIHYPHWLKTLEIAYISFEHTLIFIFDYGLKRNSNSSGKSQRS